MKRLSLALLRDELAKSSNGAHPVVTEKRRVEWQPGHYVTAMFARSPLERKSSDVLVMAHGAGHSMSSELISYFHVEIARRGFLTVKFNFPYMEPRFRPFRTADPTNVLVSCYNRVLDETIQRAGTSLNLYVGGLSMGAAVASHVVSDEPGRNDVNGLFFLSYPVHYPRHSEILGVQHLQRITNPMLFIAGTKDPWSRPEVLKRVVQDLGSRATLFLVNEASHGLKVRGVPNSKTLRKVADGIEAWVATIASKEQH